MKDKFIKPDFNNNIVNISATLAEYFNVKTNKATLPVLEDYLKQDYKNIVFIIFDGLGMYPINENLDNSSFIKNNVKQVLTSTFPSTTTNATTTLLTAKYPLEHGYLGWSLYFEELSRAVDIYLSSDSYTQDYIDPEFIKERLPIEPYYKYAKTDYKINKVVPEYWHDGIEENRYTFFHPYEMFELLDELLNREGKQFIYTYCPQPDYTMHKCGATSQEAKEVINELDESLEKLVVNHDDTLFIITADHGHIDVEECIEFYKDKELNDMLKWPPILEPRAAGFKVKEEYKEKFKDIFNNRYGNDFVLLETSYLLEQGYFGDILTENTKLLGDYMAIATSDKLLLFSENHKRFKGHHTSLTKEMLVPLIIKGSKKKVK